MTSVLLRLLNSSIFFWGYEIAGLIIALAAARMDWRPQWLDQPVRAFARLAQRRTACIVGAGVTMVVLRLALLPLFPVPVPGVHDEYSYLLGADTFAHGHLANPMHPLWPFFESFQILQRPHYMSMYPVAQALFLTIGQLLGSPWFGVLLSVGLLCSATEWMLLGWVTPPWALLGTCLLVLRLALVSYWIDSYWGGAVAALGGTLLLGAVSRLVRSPRISDSLLCGLGILLLANSRPYEGLIYTIPLGIWLLYRLFLARPRFSSVQLAQATAPMLLLLAAGGVCMLSYFKQTTGSATLMPYVVNSQQYEPTRPFLWDKMEPLPAYNHAVMRSYYEHQNVYFEKSHHLSTWLGETFRKTTSILMFYFWPGIILTLCMVPRALRSIEGRIAFATIAAVWCAVAVEIWPMFMHYTAPMTGATLLLMVVAIRESRRLHFWGVPVGRSLSLVIPALSLLALLFRIGAQAAHLPVPEYGLTPIFSVTPGNLERQHILERLQSLPGKQLVILHYEPDHEISHEWVYNPAQMDAAKVVWAREMSDSQMQQLLHYFADRQVWLLDPDKTPVVLVPYHAAARP